MSFLVRDGKFDVVVVAGPRVSAWPSVGVTTLSRICTQQGLSVGIFGGNDVVGRGVIPFPSTGGLTLVEDNQHRLHRISGRAVVRVAPPLFFPDPFPGWRTEGLIPLATAERLKLESQVTWKPATVILGTGNPALRFGSDLLEQGLSNDVYCLNPGSSDDSERGFVEGWEVERRRFEMHGGKIVVAEILGLRRKSALIWEFRLKDNLGIRVLEVCRVVSAGPFGTAQGFREYPPASLLFELDQTAGWTEEENVQGWKIEEMTGRAVALKIAKLLSSTHTRERDSLEHLAHRVRTEQKEFFPEASQERGNFKWEYEGKWLKSEFLKKVQMFKGVPQKPVTATPKASIECLEVIPCRTCEEVCPENAIDIQRSSKGTLAFLNEDLCTGCGKCVEACPSQAIAMIREPRAGYAGLWISAQGKKRWQKGELAGLLNRKGEPLGSARVATVTGDKVQLVQLDVPEHLIWEARSIRKKRGPVLEDDFVLSSFYERSGTEPVEIFLDGEKRLVREGISVLMALFEMGLARGGDTLLCVDGSCHLCRVLVDSQKRRACQVLTRPGMVVLTQEQEILGDFPGRSESETMESWEMGSDLCPCLGIESAEILKRLEQGGLRTPEAILQVTHVGEGRCRGQYCMGPFKRLLESRGILTQDWIDWRFPWAEWDVTPGPRE